MGTEEGRKLDRTKEGTDEAMERGCLSWTQVEDSLVIAHFSCIALAGKFLGSRLSEHGDL